MKWAPVDHWSQRRRQEVPGGSRRFQEVPGGSGRFQEVPGGSGRLQERFQGVLGCSGRFREVPGGFRRDELTGAGGAVSSLVTRLLATVADPGFESWDDRFGNGLPIHP